MPHTNLQERNQQRLAAETSLFVRSGEAPHRACVVYPNTYPVAMGNLGFQAVFEIVDGYPGWCAERAFLPDADLSGEVGWGQLRSFESGRMLAEFDLVAFSISFETDYWHVADLLRRMGLPYFAAERDASSPLLIAGGPATFLNPEPIAPLMDAFLVGEAEEMLPEFLAVLDDHAGETERSALLQNVAERVGGVYIPSEHTPVFDGASQLGWQSPEGAPQVERRLIWDLDAYPTTTRVLSDEGGLRRHGAGRGESRVPVGAAGFALPATCTDLSGHAHPKRSANLWRPASSTAKPSGWSERRWQACPVWLSSRSRWPTRVGDCLPLP